MNHPTDSNYSNRLYDGLLISNHCVKDAASKAKAENTLYNWQSKQLTAPDWIRQLEQGHTIQPSLFTKNEKGKYTHAKAYWKHTYFVCCDADNFRDIEFLDNGDDKNPHGLEPFTSETGLSELYPSLKDKAYAIGQSVSSMSDDKPPHHRRYRLIFLFDEPITSTEHYPAILVALAKEFPIITLVERSPTQPVFGNNRDGYNKFAIVGNILSLSDYPEPEPKADKVNITKSNADNESNITLKEYLDKHNIAHTACPKKTEKYFVECPYKEHHTDGICKEKDAYVSVSEQYDNKFAFYCSHRSCKTAERTTWQAFRDAHGIKPSISYNSNSKPKPKSESDTKSDEQPNLSLPEDRFFQKTRGFNVKQMITELTEKDDYICYADEIYRYDNGVYKRDDNFNKRVRGLLNTRQSVSRVNETRAAFQDEYKTDLTETQHLINFTNGLLDLNTLDLLPHTPEHETVTQYPVEWKPVEYTETNCEKSKTSKLLSELMNDNSIITIMEAIGSSYHNDSPKMQTGFILTGAGSNGKSTLLKIVEQMIGKENICNTDWGDFQKQPYASHSLVGKSLALNEDFTNSSKLGGVVKKVVAGGTIRVRQIYEESFEFTPHATWIMACNDLPASSDTSYGFYRRWFIISFPNQFEKNQQKGNQLIKECTEPAEKELFTSLCIQAYRQAWKRGYYTEPDCHKANMTMYKSISNPIHPWILENTEQDDKAKPTNRKEFFENYFDWCDENNQKPMSAQAFYAELKNNGWHIDANNQRYDSKVMRAVKGHILV